MSTLRERVFATSRYLVDLNGMPDSEVDECIQNFELATSTATLHIPRDFAAFRRFSKLKESKAVLEYRFHLAPRVLIGNYGLIFYDSNADGANAYTTILRRMGVITLDKDSPAFKAACKGAASDANLLEIDGRARRTMLDDHIRNMIYSLPPILRNDVISIGDRGREYFKYGRVGSSFKSYNFQSVPGLRIEPGMEVEIGTSDIASSFEMDVISARAEESGLSQNHNMWIPIRILGPQFRIGDKPESNEIVIDHVFSGPELSRAYSKARILHMRFLATSRELALKAGAYRNMIDEQIDDGPRVCVIIPSGGGKTTLSKYFGFDIDGIRTPDVDILLKPLRRAGDWDAHNHIWHNLMKNYDYGSHRLFFIHSRLDAKILQSNIVYAFYPSAKLHDEAISTRPKDSQKVSRLNWETVKSEGGIEYESFEELRSRVEVICEKHGIGQKGKFSSDRTYYAPTFGNTIGALIDETLAPGSISDVYASFITNPTRFDDFGSNDIKVGIFSISNTLNAHPLDLLPKTKNFIFMYPSAQWFESEDKGADYIDGERPKILVKHRHEYEDWAVDRDQLTRWSTYSLNDISNITRMEVISDKYYSGWFIVTDMNLGYTDNRLQTYEHTMSDFTKISNSMHRLYLGISKARLLLPRYYALYKLHDHKVTLCDDTRLHGIVDGIRVSVSGHAMNMLYGSYYGIVDYYRWVRSVENNILRFLHSKGSSSVKSKQALAIYKDAMEKHQLVFDDTQSIHELWHGYWDYRLAIDALYIASTMFDLPIPECTSHFSDFIEEYGRIQVFKRSESFLVRNTAIHAIDLYELELRGVS